jgi:hypothetical protein
MHAKIISQQPARLNDTLFGNHSSTKRPVMDQNTTGNFVAQSPDMTSGIVKEEPQFISSDNSYKMFRTGLYYSAFSQP